MDIHLNVDTWIVYAIVGSVLAYRLYRLRMGRRAKVYHTVDVD